MEKFERVLPLAWLFLLLVLLLLCLIILVLYLRIGFIYNISIFVVHTDVVYMYFNLLLVLKVFYSVNHVIWSSIKHGLELLKSDINSLNQWDQASLIRFHPEKCKVLCINCQPSLLEKLTFTKIYIHLGVGENLQEYEENEKDLGINIDFGIHKAIRTHTDSRPFLLAYSSFCLISVLVFWIFA